MKKYAHIAALTVLSYAFFVNAHAPEREPSSNGTIVLLSKDAQIPAGSKPSLIYLYDDVPTVYHHTIVGVDHKKRDLKTTVHVRKLRKVTPTMMLAGMLLGECRSQSDKCRISVANVAINRANADKDARYGHGIMGVLKHRKAFSCLNVGDPNRVIIYNAFDGKLDPDTPDGKAWVKSLHIAKLAMKGKLHDPTAGSTHYFAKNIKPKWVDDHGMRLVTFIDGHFFYRKQG